ncbi:DNA kinase/phosphatase Pnk1 [Sporormia fimetaria CBS 119925]|uniref:DNA kinase/phosphatase Pnk1 n=1 Tax=Sporormia fimetaria CBS 119925 TaxID=1340428 RepID=A0A6A6UWL8_9PLEO|nr:DNA kinase/phosphatase Pnk1 [Sporormia fimetaria CBS 119925]
MSSRPTLGKRASSNNKEVSPPPTKRRQQSALTSKSVANFFTPVSQKEPEKMNWRIVNDTLLAGRYGAAQAARPGKRRKIAAFDFDSTLVTSASGRRFGRDAADWKWWHSSVPAKLKSLHEDGYLVTVLSNQGGISLKTDGKSVKSDQKRLTEFKAKVGSVFTQLDLPVSVYAATAKDKYRKPRSGMWHEMLEDNDLETDDAVDLENSFFVGDAGGRDAAGKTPKDHSCVDRDFAANVGIPFYTPEEYFLQEEARPFVRPFDPAAYLQEQTAAPTAPLQPKGTFTKTNPLDIVALCGSPGAGKSSFYWRHLKPLGYERVNQDLLKTREKCLKAAKEFIENGTSVVVDNTNADPETRAHWVALAKKLGVPIRCVLFTAPPKLCEHNDAVRALNSGPDTNPEQRTMLPRMAFTGFASRYKEPNVSEGFQDITRVDFEFEGMEDMKKIWSMYWI